MLESHKDTESGQWTHTMCTVTLLLAYRLLPLLQKPVQIGLDPRFTASLRSVSFIGFLRKNRHRRLIPSSNVSLGREELGV